MYRKMCTTKAEHLINALMTSKYDLLYWFTFKRCESSVLLWMRLAKEECMPTKRKKTTTRKIRRTIAQIKVVAFLVAVRFPFNMCNIRDRNHIVCINFDFHFTLIQYQRRFSLHFFDRNIYVFVFIFGFIDLMNAHWCCRSCCCCSTIP